MLLLPAEVRAEPIELNAARLRVEVGGQHSQKDVSLPYAWDQHNKGQWGTAEFEMRFERKPSSDAPWAIYFPRVGTAYEVWLNGQLIERKGDLRQPNGPDYGLVPRYLNIPASGLAENNDLLIRIRADAGRRSGLSRLYVGGVEDVYPLFLREYQLRSGGAIVIVGFSLLVGLVSLSLWATQGQVDRDGVIRRDPLYLYAAVAELAWTFRVGHALVESPPLDWPWWGVVPVTALGVWGGFMTFFCIELAGLRAQAHIRHLRRWLILLMLLGPVVGVSALAFALPSVLTLWYAALGASFALFAAWFVAHALRSASWLQRVVAAAVVINVVVGLRDLYVFRIAPSYPSNALMYYTSMLFGVSLGYVVIMRFRAASAQARDVMQSMASRIASRERELNSSYLRLEALAREQERTAERTRILRDMHDGVGAHISAAIRQLQSGRATSDEVLQTLRESLDQLKLTIDSMHLPPGDITALLASLRYRLEPRLKACGVALHWDVEMIDAVQGLDAQGMRHLQFMVFEAISNVLQHAGARELLISARQTAEGVRLSVEDDGGGFDAAQASRKGLNSMRERANAIGAVLALDSRPGRTAVVIVVPGP